MRVKIDSQTIGSATVLFLTTTAFLFGVLNLAKPEIVKKEDRKTFSAWRAILYSTTGSLAFTILIVMVSLQVDQQYARKRKMLAKLNAAT